MTIKKAIILLYPPYKPSDITEGELEQSVIKSARESNFEIIKLIHVKNNDNCDILQELITITKGQNQITTVIIKDKSYISFANIMTCCVLGTLEMSGLIDIYTYQEPSTKCESLEISVSPQRQIKFLPIAWLHLEQLLSWVKAGLSH